MAVSLVVRLRSYLELLILLTVSLICFPITLFFHPFLAVTSPSTFRSKWFGVFWKVVGPKMAASPLQVDHIDSLLKRAQGVVLELGPGTGEQAFHFVPSQIRHMYGAEPNTFLHDQLIQKSKAAGLPPGKYTALTAGAQPGSLLPALKRVGLIPSTMSSLPEEGVFDTIIAIKSLCSAPQDRLPATLAIVQALLKPGGEFLFFEHVASDTDRLTMTFVWIVDLIWPLMMGGCRLDGRLDKVAMGMGGWSKKNVETTGEHSGYEPIRYVKGVFVKA